MWLGPVVFSLPYIYERFSGSRVPLTELTKTKPVLFLPSQSPTLQTARTAKMRSAALISLALPLFLTSLPLAAASCTNGYNGYSCSGSIYGNQAQGLSGLICCKGSSSCNFVIDGSITKCDSGTQVPLAQVGTPAATATAVTSGTWKAVGAVGAVMALTAGLVVIL